MAETALPSKKSKSGTKLDLKKWLGVTPFFLYALLFLILPSLRLISGAFTDENGRLTLAHVLELFTQKAILDAYKLSIEISAVTAIGGGIIGFLLAYSITVGGYPAHYVPS